MVGSVLQPNLALWTDLAFRDATAGASDEWIGQVREVRRNKCLHVSSSIAISTALTVDLRKSSGD